MSDLTKNDVPAQGQLKAEESVTYFGAEAANVKLAIVGNSITRHGRAEALGWYGDYGMAASCEENDYVHRLASKLEADGRRARLCVANLAEWERTRDMALLDTLYREVFAFRADIAIVRLGENAGLTENLERFKGCYSLLAARLKACGAKVILTDLFWAYAPFDAFVKEFAARQGYSFVQLHDLGSRSEMKALGKFPHAGVCMHPGDRGMAEIADRLYGAVNACLLQKP